MKIAILILIAITLIAQTTQNSSIDRARQNNGAYNSKSKSGGSSNNQAINIARINNNAYNAHSNSNTNTNSAINEARVNNRAFNANPNPEASTNPVYINPNTGQSNVQSSYAGEKKRGCHQDETGHCKNHDNGCLTSCYKPRGGKCTCSIQRIDLTPSNTQTNAERPGISTNPSSNIAERSNNLAIKSTQEHRRPVQTKYDRAERRPEPEETPTPTPTTETMTSKALNSAKNRPNYAAQ